MELATDQGMACTRIGTVGGESLVVDINGKHVIDASVQQLKTDWEGAIPCAMNPSSTS